MLDASYYQQPAVVAHTFEYAKLLAFASAGAVLVDMVQFLPFDLSIIRGERKRRWPQLPYFAAKLTWIVYIILNLALLFAPTEINCQGMLIAIELCMGLIAICCSTLLAVRTVCVFQAGGNARRLVALVVSLSVAGMAAAWLEGVADVKAAWLAEAAAPWSTGACSFLSVKKTYMVKYLLTVYVDVLVFVLLLVGTCRMGSSRIGEVLVFQGACYLLVTIPNIIIAVLTAMQLSPVISLIGAVPSSAISLMAATRLYVYLAEAAAVQPSGVSTSQVSGTIDKVGNLLFRGQRSTMYAHTNDTSSHGHNGISIDALPVTGSESSDASDSMSKLPLRQPTSKRSIKRKATSTSSGSGNTTDLELGLAPRTVPDTTGVEVQHMRTVQVEQGDLFLPDSRMSEAARAAASEHDDVVPDIAMAYPRLYGKRDSGTSAK